MPLLNTILNQEPKDSKPETSEKLMPTDGMSHYIKVFKKSKYGWGGVKEQSRGVLASCPCDYTERFSTRRAAEAFINRFPSEDLGIFTVNPAKQVGKHPFTIRERASAYERD